MSELAPIPGQIPPINRTLDILRTVVMTHENTLVRADQLLQIGPYSIRDIKGAVRDSFEMIAGNYPTSGEIQESPAPYLSTEIRGTAKIVGNMALALDRTRNYSVDPSDPKVIRDREGNTAESDDIALGLYFRPYTEAYPRTDENALVLKDFDTSVYYRRLEFLSPALNKVKMKSVFSLLEQGLGSSINEAFFDERHESRWSYLEPSDMKWSDTHVFGIHLRSDPDVRQYRYLWKGLRWMCANLMEWSSNKIVLPEDIDRPESLKLPSPALNAPHHLALDEPVIGPITDKTKDLTDLWDEVRAEAEVDEIMRRWSGEKVPDVDTEYDTDAAYGDLRS